MSWESLLQSGDERVVFPWVGGRVVRHGERLWKIEGRLPEEIGWKTFATNGRNASLKDNAEPQPEALSGVVKGYLVGDRIVADGAKIPSKIESIAFCSERVHLLETGLDRFARIAAGRFYAGGPLIYKNQEFPLGPEQDVLNAYLDKARSLRSIKGVVPALDLAFRLESFRRTEAERRRAALEKARKEEEERRLKEEQRQRLIEQAGDAGRRRQLALVDFETAARHALSVGGAEYLDHRRGHLQNEYVVRFRVDRRRYECVCDIRMRIIEAGICLTDEMTGEKGDSRFFLESLPGVIRQAERERRLVVFRHVD